MCSIHCNSLWVLVHAVMCVSQPGHCARLRKHSLITCMVTQAQPGHVHGYASTAWSCAWLRKHSMVMCMVTQAQPNNVHVS